MLSLTKLYPNNSHMGHYNDWLFLGNDGLHDYYIVKSKFAFNESSIWLSIVYSDAPSDYASPCYDSLLKRGGGGLATYQTMLDIITTLEYNDIPELIYD